MRDVWNVARHEYRRVVVRRGFLLGVLAIPLVIAISIAGAIAIEELTIDRRPIGYVDQSGLLDARRQAQLPDPQKRVEIRAYADEGAAQAALEREELQAYFVLPVDYAITLRTGIVYLERPPGDDVRAQFNDFLRANLAADPAAGLPADVQQRVLDGTRVTVRDVGNDREFSEDTIINVILPFVASFLFFAATLTAAGYMMRVVADEKENRTMEMVTTSVTPGQLIGGKTLGLLAATLTQLAVYLAAVVVGLIVAAVYVKELRGVEVPWGYLGLMALYFLPAYALMAAIMIAIGAAVPDVQQGQQIAGLVNLLFIAPLFLMTVLFDDPGHPLVVLLTLFPTTAFLTVSLRWGLSSIPVWQLALSWAVLTASAAGMTWVAARVFRAGMLHYGQPLSLPAVLAALRRA